jgi:hypothetical protein
MYGVSDGASEGGKQDDSGGGTGGKKKKHVLSPEQEAEWKARLEDEWCKLPEQEKTPFYLYKKDGLGDTAERNPALAPPSADKGKGGGGGTRYNELLHAEKGTVNPLDYTAHMPCPLPAAAAYEQEIRSLNDALRQVRRRRKRRQEKRQMKQMTRQMTRQMTIEENTTCVYDFCVDRCVAHFSQPCILIYIGDSSLLSPSLLSSPAAAYIDGRCCELERFNRLQGERNHGTSSESGHG